MTPIHTPRPRMLPLAGLVAIALVTMAANECGKKKGGGGPALEPVAECTVASDCGGPAPQDCAGEWACIQGTCDYLCGGEFECLDDTDCDPLLQCIEGACEVGPIGEPEAGEPEAGEPEAGEPEAGEPEAGEPEAGEPEAAPEPGPETDPEPTPDPETTPEPDPPTSCVVSGCSGEICAAEPLPSPCIALPWYECLQYSECGGFGEDGACGWKETDAFVACMEKYETPPEPDPGPPVIECADDLSCPDGYSCTCGSIPGCPECDACYWVCVEDEPEPEPDPTSCVVSGCSGEICASEPMFSPCIFDPSYECLKYSECGSFGPDGGCGWKMTDAYYACLKGQEPPDEPGTCLADSDCPEGYVCEEYPGDACLPPPGCKPGAPCPDVCAGICVAGEPETCTEDDMSCPEGTTCQLMVCPGCACDPSVPDCGCPPCSGQCLPEEPPKKACSTDADCPKGSSCQCVPPWDASAGLIACEMICVEDEPAPGDECTSDAECPEGLVCEFTMCTGCACPDTDPDCGCGPTKCWGTCQEPTPDPVECKADEDCPEGQVCNLGPGWAVPCSPDWCPDLYPTGVCEDAPTDGACAPTGCSGQICADEEVFTTCEWKPYYACYQKAECGMFGADGGCGWKMTDALAQCLADNGGP